MDESQGLELTEGNIETVLDEIRPYLVGKRQRSCAAHMCTFDDLAFRLISHTRSIHWHVMSIIAILQLPHHRGAQSAMRKCSSLTRLQCALR